MILISTILVVNYNGQRGIRNLKIAQNQLVTNVRKTQSFTLSARDITSSSGTQTPAKYYIVRFDNNSSQYVIQTIDNSYNLNANHETVNLPQGIVISDITYITSSGGSFHPFASQLAYAAPYAKLFVYTSSDTCPTASTLVGVVQNPSCLLNISDRQVVITLRDQISNQTKTVTIYGVSGKVEAGL